MRTCVCRVCAYIIVSICRVVVVVVVCLRRRHVVHKVKVCAGKCGSHPS